MEMMRGKVIVNVSRDLKCYDEELQSNGPVMIGIAWVFSLVQTVVVSVAVFIHLRTFARTLCSSWFRSWCRYAGSCACGGLFWPSVDRNPCDGFSSVLRR